MLTGNAPDHFRDSTIVAAVNSVISVPQWFDSSDWLNDGSCGQARIAVVDLLERPK